MIYIPIVIAVIVLTRCLHLEKRTRWQQRRIEKLASRRDV